MKEDELPFPMKTSKEIRLMSKEELDIYSIEQMANIAAVFSNTAQKVHLKK